MRITPNGFKLINVRLYLLSIFSTASLVFVFSLQASAQISSDLPRFNYANLNTAQMECARRLDLRLDVNVGMGNAGVYKGKLNGSEVAIKFPTRNKESQIGLIKLMSDLKIGPKFYGITHDSKGQIGIITEFISGYHFTIWTTEFPEETPITQKTIYSLDRIGRILIENGIIVTDLQFRIDQKGELYVVDPELFTIDSSTARSYRTESAISTVRKTLVSHLVNDRIIENAH